MPSIPLRDGSERDDDLTLARFENTCKRFERNRENWFETECFSFRSDFNVFLQHFIKSLIV